MSRCEKILLLILIAISIAVTHTAKLSAEELELALPVSIARTALRQVEFQMDVKGEMLMTTQSELRVPLVLQTRQKFCERSLNHRDHVIRWYDSASAQMQIDNGQKSIQLDADLKYLRLSSASLFGGGKSRFDTLLHETSNEQLELLRTPLNVSALDSFLLTAEPSKPRRWNPQDKHVATLLDLDRVVTNQLVLIQIDEGFSLSGIVTGTVDGAETRIVLDGKLVLDRVNRQVSKIDLNIDEQRSAGPASPAFEVKGALLLKLTAVENFEPLSDQAIARLDLQWTPAELQLIAADKGFSLLHDRQWRVIVNQRKQLLLRYIVDGELLAECEIQRLPSLPPRQYQELGEWRSQLSRVHRELIQTINDTSIETDSQGTQLLRMVGTSTAEFPPVNLVIYQLTTAEGVRYQALFSVLAAGAETFGEQDLRLIGSWRFLASASVQTTAAPKNSVDR